MAFKQCRILNKDIGEDFYGSLDLEFLDIYPFIEVGLEFEGKKVKFSNGIIVEDIEAEQLIIKENRKIEILSELNNIDYKSIRALRTSESSRLIELEEQALVLRNELKQLGV